MQKPAVSILHALHITPNQVTVMGMVIAGGAAYLLSKGQFVAAAAVLLLSGFFDLLDGLLARATNKASPFGAVFDSVVDRLGEATIFLGLLLFYLQQGKNLYVVLCYITLVGSFMVSYSRSRAEGVGAQGAVGFAGRAERIILLCISLVMNQVPIALGLISVLSIGTFIHRVYHVWRTTQPKA